MPIVINEVRVEAPPPERESPEAAATEGLAPADADQSLLEALMALSTKHARAERQSAD